MTGGFTVDQFVRAALVEEDRNPDASISRMLLLAADMMRELGIGVALVEPGRARSAVASQSLRVVDAARIAGVNRSSLNIAIHEGRVPSHRLDGGGVRRVYLSDVEQWRDRPRTTPKELKCLN